MVHRIFSEIQFETEIYCFDSLISISNIQNLQCIVQTEKGRLWHPQRAVGLGICQAFPCAYARPKNEWSVPDSP